MSLIPIKINYPGSIGVLCFLISIILSCKNGFSILPKSDPVIFDQVDVTGSDLKIVLKYDSLGNKIIEGTVFNGKKNGAWFHYGTNGAMLTVINYIDDKKNGPYVKIGLDNKLDTQASYKDDVLDGLYTHYIYGSLDEQIEYKRGRKNGWAKKYYMRGGVEKAMELKDDVQDGLYRFYREDGSIMVEEKYKDGKKISGGIVNQ
jgi:uncharacterized protein